MYKITRKYQDVLKNLYILHVLQILYCVFTIHQIDHYDKLCIKYLYYYIFTIHPFFYKNSCAFISSIYDIHIIIFSFPSTISCNISFFKSQCKVFFVLFPFSGSLHILLLQDDRESDLRREEEGYDRCTVYSGSYPE